MSCLGAKQIFEEKAKETLSKVRSNISVQDMAHRMDISSISHSAMQHIFHHVSESVQRAGFKASDTPFPPISELEAHIRQLDLHSIEKFKISPVNIDTITHTVGYRNDITQVLQALVALGNFRGSKTSHVFDTVVVSLANDKAPIMHNGKAWLISHLECTTRLHSSGCQVLPKDIKSQKMNILLAIVEMKEETHSIYKVSSSL